MSKGLLAFFLLGAVGFGEPVFMDGEWAKAFCKVWNNTPELVEELGKSDSWASVPERKIFLYRRDCDKDKQVQLTIRNENGRAVCVYGGWKKDERSGDDFLLYAYTEKWMEMGRGEYGPMKAMTLGRLKFKGSKFVAMKNMGPFKAFLLAIDDVKSDLSRCP